MDTSARSATDGDMLTRMVSGLSSFAYWLVDLGESHPIKGVKVIALLQGQWIYDEVESLHRRSKCGNFDELLVTGCTESCQKLKMTTFGAASDENFVKKVAVLFQRLTLPLKLMLPITWVAMMSNLVAHEVVNGKHLQK